MLLSGTSRCLFSDKYKTHKYSVGRTYNCWTLNCWGITWPVGFKRLNCWCITWPVGFKRLISAPNSTRPTSTISHLSPSIRGQKKYFARPPCCYFTLYKWYYRNERCTCHHRSFQGQEGSVPSVTATSEVRPVTADCSKDKVRKLVSLCNIHTMLSEKSDMLKSCNGHIHTYKGRSSHNPSVPHS